MAKAKLKDLVEGLEMVGFESCSYVNTRTGQVVTLTEEEVGYAEDDGLPDDSPDWMNDVAALARDVLESGDYIEMPDQWDIHEYQLISDFCWDQTDTDIRDRLLGAIRGKGAFRRFKDTAMDLGVIDQWYEYRRARFEEIAIEWCNENNIAWE